jgi:hypothetical protein
MFLSLLCQRGSCELGHFQPDVDILLYSPPFLPSFHRCPVAESQVWCLVNVPFLPSSQPSPYSNLPSQYTYTVSRYGSQTSTIFMVHAPPLLYAPPQQCITRRAIRNHCPSCQVRSTEVLSICRASPTSEILNTPLPPLPPHLETFNNMCLHEQKPFVAAAEIVPAVVRAEEKSHRQRRKRILKGKGPLVWCSPKCSRFLLSREA